MLRRVVLGALRGRQATRSQSSSPRNGAPAGPGLKALIASLPPEQAERELRRRLNEYPDDAEAHRLLGGLLGASGRLDEAQRLLARALEIDPAGAETLADMGNVHRLLGAPDRAEACYRQALSMEPTLLNARLNLASLLEAHAPQEAADLYLDIATSTSHPLALRGAVTLLDRLGRDAQAIALCRQALEREPEHVEAHRGLGFLLLKRRLSPAAALDHFERVLARDAADVEVLANRGIALQDLGRIDEAVASYDAALRLQPDHVHARFHRSLALLLRGDFARGWVDYDLRLLTEDRPQRRFAAPRWRGENLSGKALLVCAEQGLGDEIMFASCLDDAAKVCARLVVECAPKLARLFARSFPDAEVVAAKMRQDEAFEADVFVPAGSLPLYFRPSWASFPPHKGYLRPDPQRAKHYRARLESLGAGLKIGISWRGGTSLTRAPIRTVALDELLQALPRDGVRLVNLQYDTRGDEIERLRHDPDMPVAHWPEALADYDDTAALVSGLDLVVSVCTAVVHLAGALGRPTWVMAPCTPEWRYGHAGEAMPWYPSVRVLRQQVPGQWQQVLARVAAGIRSLPDARYLQAEETR